MESRAGILAILTVVLTLIAAALGISGSSLTLSDGTVVTPEAVYNLILAVVAPLTLLIATILGVIHSLQNRVSTQDVDPAFFSLLFTREFMIAAVGGVVFIIQVLAHVRIFDEATQAIIADAILAIITVFLWGGTKPAIQAARRY